ADIDYAIARGDTTYGVIGIKVWIFKGEIIGKMPLVAEQPAAKPKRKNNRKAK
ncbi:MAG: 30S ribosomal protein S3, partial [Colwellia sp.]|nr:30S ribosomal protein S3 [Colwellia sp.]